MVKKTKVYWWTHEKVGMLLKIDFVRFGTVGITGFIVTVIGKALSQHTLQLDPATAIFIGSEAGVLSNFIFHERWTYKYVDHHHKSLLKKFFHFQLSSLSGVLLFTLIGIIIVKVFNHDSIITLAVAAGITMFWNFFWTKYFIFKGKTPAVLLNPEDTVELEVI
jgi:putative flippase GtrA